MCPKLNIASIICSPLSIVYQKLNNKYNYYIDTTNVVIETIKKRGYELEESKEFFITEYDAGGNFCLDKILKYKHHIDLNRLPLTVGKMAGAVDMVINETSISRMHAKFSKGGNKVYVTDLNSTNGTFKNGLRLEPNASEIIEPGDEIRLGKLKFIYR